MRRVSLALALMAILATTVWAQQNPPVSIGERIVVRGQPPVMMPDWNVVRHDMTPKYCKPCLFYAGDFDASNTGANALWNGNSGGVQGSVWAPFQVKKAAHATGLFLNTLTSGTGAINNPTPYAINIDMSSSGGMRVVAGSGTATTAPTGRSGFGLIEVTLQIRKIQTTALKAKKVYYLSVVPQDSTGQEWYETDVEDVPPPNHYGMKNKNDDSWFDCPFCSHPLDIFFPTWGSSGSCAGTGCDMFSIGVTGKEHR